MYQGACVCLDYGMRAQKAISSILAEVDMIGETGGSIKAHLESHGQIADLMKSLEEINRDCVALPPDLFSKVRELRDYVKETPSPFESDVKRDTLVIERFLKKVIEDSCR